MIIKTITEVLHSGTRKPQGLLAEALSSCAGQTVTSLPWTTLNLKDKGLGIYTGIYGFHVIDIEYVFLCLDRLPLLKVPE